VNWINTALTGFALFAAIGSVAAQDRMPPIPDDKMTDAQKKAAAEVIAGPRGALYGPFVPLLRSPDLMSRVQKVGEYLRYHSSIEEKLNEFVILLAARRLTQHYEWDFHYPLAIKAGVKKETLEAIREGRRPTGMTTDEELLYDFTDELARNQSVSDATYARVIKRFGEQGVVDLVGVTGYYGMVGMLMNVTRTPVDKPQAPPLAPFPH
jgi:4-carboxymuconolactone decarboxylase